MKTTEIQNFVKNAVIADLGIAEKGTEIGRGKFAIPVTTPEDGIVYATVTVTCARFNSTEKVKAFDLDEAVAKYEADEAERVAKAEAIAAERAAKKAAKTSKEVKAD